jgi:hypothetical protein
VYLPFFVLNSSLISHNYEAAADQTKDAAEDVPLGQDDDVQSSADLAYFPLAQDDETIQEEDDETI